MSLATNMMLALLAVRDGGHLTRAEQFWLRSEFYITKDNKLTMKGHNELNNAENLRDATK